MKLAKQKPSALQRICKILDEEKVIYARASVKIQDAETKQDIETVAVMVTAVFGAKSGKYLFSAPIAQPSVNNHKPTPSEGAD